MSTRFFAALAATALPLASPPPTEPFDEARLFLEYNATDEDAEVVIQVDADAGLERFRVVAPDGKVILDLRARGAEGLGIRKLDLETPEPGLEAVLAAYPEGEYSFFGRTTDGEILASTVALSHELPAAPQLTFPTEGQTGVPLGGAASWTPVAGAAGYFLEIENDDLGVDLKSHVVASQTSFGFPAGWLLPDTEYQIGIAARGANGNLSVTELDFTTGP